MPRQQPEFTISHADWGHLNSRVESLEDAVRILTTGNEAVTEQIAELTVSMRRADEHRRRLEDTLQTNTELTREVLESTRDTREMVQLMRDVQASGRLGARVAKMFGGALKRVVMWGAPLIVAAAGAWWSIKGGPPKP
jgi:hypothetical protein